MTAPLTHFLAIEAYPKAHFLLSTDLVLALLSTWSPNISRHVAAESGPIPNWRGGAGRHHRPSTGANRHCSDEWAGGGAGKKRRPGDSLNYCHVTACAELAFPRHGTPTAATAAPAGRADLDTDATSRQLRENLHYKTSIDRI